MVCWDKIGWTLSTFSISLTPTTRFHGDKNDKRLPRDAAYLLHCRFIKLDRTLSGLGSRGWVSVPINIARFSVSCWIQNEVQRSDFVIFSLDGDCCCLFFKLLTIDSPLFYNESFSLFLKNVGYKKRHSALFVKKLTKHIVSVCVELQPLVQMYVSACVRNIDKSKGALGTRAPFWVQFLSFSCSFQPKICKIICWRRLLGWCHFVWEILCPSLKSHRLAWFGCLVLKQHRWDFLLYFQNSPSENKFYYHSFHVPSSCSQTWMDFPLPNAPPLNPLIYWSWIHLLILHRHLT